MKTAAGILLGSDRAQQCLCLAQYTISGWILITLVAQFLQDLLTQLAYLGACLVGRFALAGSRKDLVGLLRLLKVLADLSTGIPRGVIALRLVWRGW